MGNTTTGYQKGSGRPTSACSRDQALSDTLSAIGRWRPYSADYQYQQGSGRPTATYSRYTGEGLGSYTHNSQAGNRAHNRSINIGRIRLAEQFPYRFPVSEITVPALDKLLIEECGNECQHPHLSEEKKATLRFLRAAISFVPLALDAGADMQNASFFFAHLGMEFAVVAGKGEWEFLFYPDYHGQLCGYCVRKPWLRYICDGVISTVRRVSSFSMSTFHPSLLALE